MEVPQKKPRGGKREGAGRPVTGAVYTEQVNFLASPAQVKRWQKAAKKAKLGIGEWIRLACDSLAKGKQDGST